MKAVRVRNKTTVEGYAKQMGIKAGVKERVSRKRHVTIFFLVPFASGAPVVQLTEASDQQGRGPMTSRGSMPQVTLKKY